MSEAEAHATLLALLSGAVSGDYDERVSAQTKALASLGFGPAVHLGDIFGPTAAPCLTCGALVMLRRGFPEGEVDHIKVHRGWHTTPAANEEATR